MGRRNKITGGATPTAGPTPPHLRRIIADILNMFLGVLRHVGHATRVVRNLVKPDQRYRFLASFSSGLEGTPSVRGFLEEDLEEARDE